MENEYPKMLYHSDGRTQIVHSREEESGLNDFQDKPSEAHLTPTHLGAARMTPVSPHDELLGKIRGLFEEFMGEEKTKRGPGRPKKDSDNG